MMRDFNMRRQGHGAGFGAQSMARPLVIGVVVLAGLGLVVMSLWNALLPAILGVKSIGFWQALGLLVLCRILFGGLGVRPGMFGRGRRRMHERWMQMTPEEREQFARRHREGFRVHGHHRGERRGHCHHHDEHYGGRRERNDDSERSRQQPEENTQKQSEAE